MIISVINLRVFDEAEFFSVTPRGSLILRIKYHLILVAVFDTYQLD